MSSITDRIEQLFLEQGIGKRQIKRKIADVCNISYQAVQQWFNSDTKSIKAEHLEAIANATDSTVEYLLRGNNKFAREPAVAYTANAGTKVIALSDVTRWQSAESTQYLPTPPGEFAGFYVVAPDDMMQSQAPTSIAKGVYVAFNTLKTEPVDEKIYLIASDDRPEPVIRKLVKIAGQWELQPENPKYQSERFIEPLQANDKLVGRLAGIANFVE